LNDVDEQDDEGNDQQEVDVASNGIGAHEAKTPQDE